MRKIPLRTPDRKYGKIGGNDKIKYPGDTRNNAQSEQVGQRTGEIHVS
jgi:hypothetical protein